MESKDELKEIDIKDRTCYYFDDIMWVRDIDFSDVLLTEKSYKAYENISIHDISYKIPMGAKPFHSILGSVKQMDLLKIMKELDI